MTTGDNRGQRSGTEYITFSMHDIPKTVFTITWHPGSPESREIAVVASISKIHLNFFLECAKQCPPAIPRCMFLQIFLHSSKIFTFSRTSEHIFFCCSTMAAPGSNFPFYFILFYPEAPIFLQNIKKCPTFVQKCDFCAPVPFVLLSKSGLLQSDFFCFWVPIKGAVDLRTAEGVLRFFWGASKFLVISPWFQMALGS